jgi:hypothetical protein
MINLLGFLLCLLKDILRLILPSSLIVEVMKPSQYGIIPKTIKRVYCMTTEFMSILKAYSSLVSLLLWSTEAFGESLVSFLFVDILRENPLIVLLMVEILVCMQLERLFVIIWKGLIENLIC